MNSKSYIEWLTLFKSCAFREGTSSKLQYKRNCSVINNTTKNIYKVINRDKDALHDVNIFLPNELFSLNIPYFSKLLLQDAINTSASVINFNILHKQLHSSSHTKNILWKKISPMFTHSIRRTYDKLNNSSSLQLSYNNTVKLQTKFGRTTIENILWPDYIFSKSCRGIGISNELFEKLSPRTSYTSGQNVLQKFMNPINNLELPIFVVDSIPDGYQGIGLFPQYIPDQKKYFKDIDLFGALLKSNLCTQQECEYITDLMDHPGIDANNDKINLDPIINKHKLIVNDIFSYPEKSNQLRKLMKSDIPVYSSDSMRSMLLSDRCYLPDYEEEVYKNFILFSIFTTALKLQLNTMSTSHDIAVENKLSHNLKDWDYFILNRHFELQSLSNPKNLEEMITLKKKYDIFLKNFYCYSLAASSEQKLYKNELFEATYKKTDNNKEKKFLPRSSTLILIMSNILKSSKLIKLFSPNLHTYVVKNRILGGDANVIQFNSFEKLIASKTNIDTSIEKGQCITSLISEVLGMEDTIFECVSRFDKSFNQNIDTSQWKLLLQTNSLPDEFSTLLKYTSPVNMKVIKKDENLLTFNNFVCERRKLIDSNTMLYAYRRNNKK